MQTFKIVDFQRLGDRRGQLFVAEAQGEIPFEIKRFFYMVGTEKEGIRGEHANRNSQFVMICLQGSVEVKTDDGFRKESFFLEDPAQGLYLNKMVWKTMKNFSADAILLVVSSHTYDGQEYIRSYEDFLAEVKK